MRLEYKALKSQGFFKVRKLAIPVIAAVLSFSVSACGTINIVGDETVSGLSRAQKEMRHQAASLSATVWESVKERSFMDTIAGMLIDGREDTDGPGLVADIQSQRYSEAKAYMAEKEQSFFTADAQLDAMVQDVRVKTLQAKAFVEAAESVVATYQAETSLYAPITVAANQAEAKPRSTKLVEGLLLARADRAIVETSVASVKRQAQTFDNARIAYLELYPAANAEVLENELKSFHVQIARMERLADIFSEVTQTV